MEIDESNKIDYIHSSVRLRYRNSLIDDAPTSRYRPVKCALSTSRSLGAFRHCMIQFLGLRKVVPMKFSGVIIAMLFGLAH